MSDFQNFSMLPRRAQDAVRRMVRIRGLDINDETLAEEARLLRIRSGWFVWDYPSTAFYCRQKRLRLEIPEYEVPKFPEL